MKKTEILQMISEVEQQMKCQYKYCIDDPAWRFGRTRWTYSLHPKTMYELARIEDTQGNNCILYIDGCEYYDENLIFIVKAQNVTNKEDVFATQYRAKDLLSRNVDNTSFWNRRVPFVVQHAICDTLTHFERVKIANSELTIQRGWTLEKLSLLFTAAFVAEIQFFDGQKRITDGNLRIDEIGNVTCDSLIIRGVDQVGEVVKKIHESFGLNVRIVNKKYGREVNDLVSLFMFL